MSIIIKGGTIVTSEKTYISDIKIQDEYIVEIGANLNDESSEIIDANNHLIFPGFIDSHTHLDLDTGYTKTADNFETGTLAAIKGGTTTVLDFATQNKGETLEEALNNWHKLAQNISSCDYGFHMAITQWNSLVKNEIPLMKKHGITSYKAYMAYDNLRINDGEIYELLKTLKENNSILGVHCENGDLINSMIKDELEKGHKEPFYHHKCRPNIVEAEAISRFLDIAYLLNTTVYIVHLSTEEGLKNIERARNRNQKVYIETCPQYLILNNSLYQGKDFQCAKYVLSPPLRDKKDQVALWNGLKNNSINIIGTDHCSFNYKGQKEYGLDNFSKIPNGIPGIQHRPLLIYTYGVKTKKITLEQMCALLSENSAKLFGMYPKKGIISVGSYADIVIWNTEKKGIISAKTQIQNVDYTPFENFETIGGVKDVFLRGVHVVKNGEIIRKKLGKYIKRDGDYV